MISEAFFRLDLDETDDHEIKPMTMKYIFILLSYICYN
jgi:hypothetical protein